MRKLTLNDAACDQIVSAAAILELFNGAGRKIGYFVPTLSLDLLEPQISEEEIRRRCADPERYTFEEVMAHLRSL